MRAAVVAAVEAGELAVTPPDEVVVERPRVKEHGDYATSVALQLAKPAGRPPREVAELLAVRLRERNGIDAVGRAQPRRDQLGDLTGRATGRLGQLQGDVRGVVAVLLHPRALDDDLRRRRHGQLAGLDGGDDGSPDGSPELERSHLTRLSPARA